MAFIDKIMEVVNQAKYPNIKQTMWDNVKQYPNPAPVVKPTNNLPLSAMSAQLQQMQQAAVKPVQTAPMNPTTNLAAPKKDLVAQQMATRQDTAGGNQVAKVAPVQTAPKPVVATAAKPVPVQPTSTQPVTQQPVAPQPVNTQPVAPQPASEYTPMVAPEYSMDNAYAEAMAQLQAQMQQIMSPQYFNQVLSQVMSSYQPLIDANTQGINTQFNEYRRQADVDADRRGMFMSGAAGENQRMLSENEASQVNRMKAEIQAQASGQAQNMVQSQLQAAMQMGELGAKYAGLTQNDRQFAATLDMNYDKMNQEQRNFMDELGFKKQMHTDEQKNFYDGMQLKYYELDQQQRQFLEEMGFKRQQLVSQENIAKMQYSANKAAAASDNEIALAKLELEQARYKDAKAYQDAEQKLMMLQVEQQAFGELNADLMAVKNGANWSELAPKYEVYKDPVYGDLYKRLTQTKDVTAQEMAKEAEKKNQKGLLFSDVGKKDNAQGFMSGGYRPNK